MGVIISQVVWSRKASPTSLFHYVQSEAIVILLVVTRLLVLEVMLHMDVAALCTVLA